MGEGTREEIRERGRKEEIRERGREEEIRLERRGEETWERGKRGNMGDEKREGIWER